MHAPAPGSPTAPFWTRSADAVSIELDCGHDGLTTAQADERLAHYGPNADAI
ncbi:cation-transporting P-type ATPase, partial [Pseudomonas sp. EL_65y_Pfl1_R83]